MGIEPISIAWKAMAQPLYQFRICGIIFDKAEKPIKTARYA